MPFLDADLHVRVLGPITIERDGNEHSLRELTARLLSALIIAERSGLTTGAAVEAIWDEPPKTAVTGLRGHVRRLRQILGDDGGEVVITLDQGGYRLQLDLYQLDAHRFEQECLAAEASMRRRAFPEAVDCGYRALEIWRGQPFMSCDEVPGVSPERARLTEIWIRVVLATADALILSGQADDAIGLLRPIVTSYPDSESFSRLLMRALASADRNSEALREYDRLEGEIHAEFGQSPSEQTIALINSIADNAGHDAQLGNPVGAVLPTENQQLVGREQELASVLESIRSQTGGLQLTIINGPAGIGKTSLLTACAQTIFDETSAVLFGTADRSRISFGVFRTLFQRVDATSAGDPIGTLRPVLARFAPELAGAGQSPPPVGTDERWREDLFSATASWIADLTSPVMFLDDFQWIDPDSLDLIRSLRRDKRLQTLRIVAAVRTDIDDVGNTDVLLAEFQRDQALNTYTLGPLDVDSLVALAEGIGATCLVADDLVAKTGGNALLAVEYAKSQTRSPVPIHAADSGAPLGLFVRSRLSELGDEGTAVARVAATLGHRFLQREAMLALPDRSVFAAGMAQCEAAELVSPAAEQGWYEFAHGLVQEQIALQISTIERQALRHRLYTELAAEDPERRAQHALGASHLLSFRELLNALVEAGEAALHKSAFATSAEFFERALALQRTSAPLERAEECRLLVRFAQTQVHVDEARAGHLLREAGVLARPLEDSNLIADIADVRIGMNLLPDQRDVELLETALLWPATGQANGVQARLKARLAVDLLGVDPSDRAHILAQQSIDTAKKLAPGAERDTALLRAMWALAFTGEVRQTLVERMHFLDEYRALSRAIGDADAELLAEAHIAVLGLGQRDYDAVEASAARFRELAERQSWPRYSSHAIALDAAIASERGQRSCASQLSADAQAIAQAAGYVEGATYVPFGHNFCRKFHDGTLSDVAGFFGDLWRSGPQPALVGCGYAAAAAAAEEHEQAMETLHVAAGADLSLLPRDTVYSACLMLIASAVFDMGEAGYTRPGLDLLEPLRGTNVVAGAGIGLFGPAEAGIGRFLAAGGHTERARAELLTARRVCVDLKTLAPLTKIEADLDRLRPDWRTDER